jgi:uncharacterized RDD family membrane protein YckC
VPESEVGPAERQSQIVNQKSKMENSPMTPNAQTAKPARGPSDRRPEPRVRVRFRAPFALRCGALLIDYILLALILTFSIMVARLMGGGARMAGGNAEKIGILITLFVAVLDLGVVAGLRGKTVGKWTTGLRIERMHGGPPGILRALLRHFVGYPLSLLPFGLGFLIVTVMPTGRSLHDFIAGTVVVREYATPVVEARRPRPQGAQV